MLDINDIRRRPEFYVDKLAQKGTIVDLSAFLEKDKQRRDIIVEVEALKARRNKVSAQVPTFKKQGQDVSEILAKMKTVGDQIKVLDEQLSLIDRDQFDFLAGLPNIPADDVVPGGKENNQVVSVFGEKPTFDFMPMHHVDLVEKLEMIDYTRGAKLSGNGYWMYRKDGARLEWALLNYFIDSHLADGYEFILPPHMLGAVCGYAAGQFPKFKDEVYQVKNDFRTLCFRRRRPRWSTFIVMRSSRSLCCLTKCLRIPLATARKPDLIEQKSGA